MMTATIGQRPRQRDADGRGKKKERAEMDPPNEVWTDERTGERSEGADGQSDWGGGPRIRWKVVWANGRLTR